MAGSSGSNWPAGGKTSTKNRAHANPHRTQTHAGHTGAHTRTCGCTHSYHDNVTHSHTTAFAATTPPHMESLVTYGVHGGGSRCTGRAICEGVCQLLHPSTQRTHMHALQLASMHTYSCRLPPSQTHAHMENTHNENRSQLLPLTPEGDMSCLNFCLIFLMKTHKGVLTKLSRLIKSMLYDKSIVQNHFTDHRLY